MSDEMCACGRPLIKVEGGVTHTLEDEDHHLAYFASMVVEIPPPESEGFASEDDAAVYVTVKVRCKVKLPGGVRTKLKDGNEPIEAHYQKAIEAAISSFPQEASHDFIGDDAPTVVTTEVMQDDVEEVWVE